MNKFIGIVLIGLLLSGCGSNESKSTPEFKGVVENKNYLAQGMMYLKKSEIPKAISSFDQAIKQDPKDANNYMILGEVYLKLKEYTKAVDTFSGAALVDPNNGDAFYFLAISKRLQASVEKSAESAQDSKEEAVLAAKRSIEIFMQNRDEQKFKRSVGLLKSLESDQIKNIQQAVPASDWTN